MSPPTRGVVTGNGARFREQLGELRDAARRSALEGARTPLGPREASDALERAWTDRTGARPSQSTLGMLWAQWALETGRGASMRGYNFGNVKGRSPAGHSAELETSEGYGALAERVTARFRTYASAEEGARDYIDVLAERFPRSFDAAVRGDVTGFASELRREGYFTAEPNAYARGVQRLAREHASGRALLRSTLEVHASRESVNGLLWTLERARRRD